MHRPCDPGTVVPRAEPDLLIRRGADSSGRRRVLDDHRSRCYATGSSGSAGSDVLPDGGEHQPVVVDPLESLRTARLEHDPGSGDQVLDRVRGQDLPATSQRADPRRDMDGDPGDVVADELDLAGVQPGPDLEPLRRDRVADDERGPDRARRPVEGGQEPVTGRLDLAATEPLEGEPDRRDRGQRGRSRQRASPSSPARRVESTMSVKRTVASTRSGSTIGEAPVRNSSISRNIGAVSPAQA